jgi:hypothetical protein
VGEDGGGVRVEVAAANAQDPVALGAEGGIPRAVFVPCSRTGVAVAVDLDAQARPAEVDLDLAPADVDADVRERGRQARRADEREEAVLELAARPALPLA